MRRLWRRRAAAVPAPPPAAGSSELQGPAPKGQRFWRWFAVMLLVTAVALIPQFRGYLAGAGEIARELVRGTPSVAATPVLAPGTGRAREDEKADGTATATPQPAASVSELAVETQEAAADDAPVAAPPPPTATPEPAAPIAAARAIGTQWQGAPLVERVTMWIQPGFAIVALYDPDTRFTVMEPDRYHPAYPVILDGVEWVRVRAADGLAGWVKASELRAAGGS